MNASKARVVRIQRIDSEPIESPGRPATPEVVALDVSSQRRTPRIVHWCLLLYVFSIPLELVSLGFTSQYLSFSKMMGLLFFATYFFYYNPLLGLWPSPSPACRWFLIYVAIFTLNGFFLPEKFTLSFFWRLSTMLQLIVFFWVAADLCKDEKILLQVLWIYAVASSILAVGMLLQLPAFNPTLQETGGGIQRGTVMGYNGNMLATMWALAIVALVGLCLHPSYMLATKLLWAFLAFIVLMATVYAGSRAGLGSLLFGFIVYLIPRWRTQRKLCTILFAILGIATTIYFSINNDTIMKRWDQTVEGKLDGREKIVPAALKTFIDRPLIGWKPIVFQYELGRRLGLGAKDPHNLFLYLLLEVGLIGAVPFFIGLWMCARTAWQARKRHLGLLPLALLITLLAATMSHTQLAQKWFWLILACAASAPAAGYANTTKMLLIRRSVRNEV